MAGFTRQWYRLRRRARPSNGGGVAVRPGGPFAEPDGCVAAFTSCRTQLCVEDTDGAANCLPLHRLNRRRVRNRVNRLRAKVGRSRFFVGELTPPLLERGGWQDAPPGPYPPSVSYCPTTTRMPDRRRQVFASAVGAWSRSSSIPATIGNSTSPHRTPWVEGDWVFVVTDLPTDRGCQTTQGPLDQPAAAVRKGKGQARPDHLSRPIAGRRTADRGRFQWHGDQRRPGDRKLPEPDQCRFAHRTCAGGRQFDAVHPRQHGPPARL